MEKITLYLKGQKNNLQFNSADFGRITPKMRFDFFSGILSHTDVQ